MQRSIRLIVFFIFSVFGLTSGFGRDVIEVESRYLGDGWFQYNVRTLADPLITDISFGWLVPYPFTNYISSIVPTHWTNNFDQGEWIGIAYDASSPQPRVNEVSFSARSGSMNFKRKEHGLDTGIAFVLADCFRERYISGFLSLPCLIPCAPDEADGSPPQLVARFELIPDLVVNQLILTNNEVHGLTFSGVSIETVELQGSHDLTNWTAIARFPGVSPGTWSTNAPLNSCGEFFRLRAVPIKY